MADAPVPDFLHAWDRAQASATKLVIQIVRQIVRLEVLVGVGPGEVNRERVPASRNLLDLDAEVIAVLVYLQFGRRQPASEQHLGGLEAYAGNLT